MGVLSRTDEILKQRDENINRKLVCTSVSVEKLSESLEKHERLCFIKL